jgi:hypothetical protein
MSQDIKFLNKFAFTLDPDEELSERFLALYGTIRNLDKLRPHLVMQRAEEGDNMWNLSISRLTREAYESAESLNERLNEAGEDIFGEGNFECSAEFSEDPEGATGSSIFNWEALTRCKIILPGEEGAPALREDSLQPLGTYHPYLHQIDAVWKETPTAKAPKRTEVEYIYPITSFEQRPSAKSVFEALYWGHGDK